MKFLVCISKVPDTTTKISFVENNTKFNSEKVTFIINPYDEWYALVRALEIKESQGGSVTVLNVGPAENDQIIRKALAIGADDAIRINAEPLDAFHLANQIAAVAKEGGYDMILTGKESIDYNGGQLGGMIAELMDLPYIPLATSLDIENGKALITREIEGGKEKLEASLPLVLSANKGMAEARIPNMRGIMSARTKPLKVVEAIEAESLTSVKEYALPPEKSAVKLIDAETPEKLIDLLHNEAKVI
ncbi:MAG: electron transfer flavoprotein beta subunit/FixA family protein [Chitinophagaceae bacterium]|nr:MAG: electron transfer flavoprotein beta subunit/FixA family protein [Chitinophagaceae bacterium]